MAGGWVSPFSTNKNAGWRQWVRSLTDAELQKMIGRMSRGDPFNGNLPTDDWGLSAAVPVLAEWRREGFA
jgi:hypothetical protein